MRLILLGVVIYLASMFIGGFSFSVSSGLGTYQYTHKGLLK